jgi:exosortase D (VPLPA-CTERM-specific)
MMPAQWIVLILSGAALATAFLSSLSFMVQTWDQVPEFSYGYFIPAISAFLVWQRSDRLRELELRGSWSGLWLVALALVLGLVSEFSAIRMIGQYGFVAALFGLSVIAIGWSGTRIIAVPLGILLFMVPLPQFLLRELSQQLQLVSSELGVWLIRRFGVSVFLEGNVIDLGSYKLQVVEACSGLRYLFPLMILGLLAAYFFQGALWKRALIVASTVPMTILMNSLRIGVIGVSVDRYGPQMADGLLHDFEGFFIFMVCVVLLVAEMGLLARLGGTRAPLRNVFGLEVPAPWPRGVAIRYRRLSIPTLAGFALIAAVAAVLHGWPAREPVHPQRTNFAEFPMTLAGGWSGRPDRLERDVASWLGVDDYLLANYARPGEAWVNLYGAWYSNQSGGQSTHSPRTCIPGGGWAITQITEWPVDLGHGGRLQVNRAIIQKGDQRQLVYYWFGQRSRVLTDELVVKWYILVDALRSGRTDGALLRLVTPISQREDIGAADLRLASFLGTVQPLLRSYVPD